MAITAGDVIPFTRARARLSDLVDEVRAGAEKIITKNGESCVALIAADRLDYYHRLEASASIWYCWTKPKMAWPMSLLAASKTRVVH